jgi:hypothetical protein
MKLIHKSRETKKEPQQTHSVKAPLPILFHLSTIVGNRLNIVNILFILMYIEFVLLFLVFLTFFFQLNP